MVDVAGIIEKLELTNFMCHSNLALTFNPKINFIVGKNGSGKSALMTSLMIVLGTKAADTSRGKAISSFIKIGCNQARVRVTLANRGMNAYMPEKYGPRIVITRFINKASSRYTVETVNEGSATCSSGELRNIMRALHIILPNPFALMTQETMKTFFMSSDPRKMYELIREGTGIKDTAIKLAALDAEHKAIEKKCEVMRQALEETEKEFKIWSQKKKILGKISSAKEKIATLEKEFVWAKVVEEEAKLKSVQDQLEKIILQKAAREKSLLSQQGKQDELRDQIKKLDEDIAGWKAQQEMKSSERSKIQAVHEKYLTELSNFRTKLQNITSQMQVKKTDKKVLQDNINQVLKQSSPEEVQRREEKQKLLESMEAELVNTQATKVTVNAELERFRAEARDVFGAANHMKLQLQEQQETCQKKRSEFQLYKKQSGTIPPVYGHKMADFMKEIQREHEKGKFSRQPIGPIGMHVKVKDPQWELAAEAYLKSEFLNFFCNTNEDRILLTEISKRVMPSNFRIVCVTSKFVDQVFDVRRNKADAPDDMVNLMDVLLVENPIVMNYLIDQKGIESVALCRSLPNAMKLMSNERSVPHNCKQVVTMEGEYLYPAPLYRYYSAEIRNVQFLVKNKAASVRGMEQQIKEEEERLGVMKQDLAQHEKNASSVKQEMNRTQSQLKKIEDREFSLRAKIRKHKDEEQEFSNLGIATTLQDEMAKADEEMLRLDEQRKKLLREESEAKEKKIEIVTSLQALIPEFSMLKKNIQDTANKKFDIENDLDEERAKQDMFRKKFSEFNSKESQLVYQVEAQNSVVQKAENTASQSCSRVTTRRSSQTVQKDIDGQKVFANTLNSNLEDPKLIIKKVNELEASRKKLRDDMEPINTLVKDLGLTVKTRKAHYANLTHCTLNMISETFSVLIKRQHFEGNLQFDTKAKVLNINLKMKGKGKESLKNLSGGERSYTTISLILAVWEKLRIPFYMLDEFDVFMDMVNRRNCSDMLVAEAKRKQGRQFIFFTPQEMNMEAADNVTIHKLHDPRRN